MGSLVSSPSYPGLRGIEPAPRRRNPSGSGPMRSSFRLFSNLQLVEEKNLSVSIGMSTYNNTAESTRRELPCLSTRNLQQLYFIAYGRASGGLRGVAQRARARGLRARPANASPHARGPRIATRNLSVGQHCVCAGRESRPSILLTGPTAAHVQPRGCIAFVRGETFGPVFL